jgi:hypothetical protein
MKAGNEAVGVIRLASFSNPIFKKPAAAIQQTFRSADIEIPFSKNSTYLQYSSSRCL